jgi:2-methylcitrate dehydratase PrpD
MPPRPSRSGQTRELAEFVSSWPIDQIPPKALDRARVAIADLFGVALAGRRSVPGRQMLEYVLDQGARPVSGILGGGATTPELAALVNGTLAHALEFDDSNHPLYGHPSSHLVPAFLAAGGEYATSFEQALAAYVVGFETDAALAGAMNMTHYEIGFHSTGTIGTVGAAATAARTMGLDVPTTQHALAIAASRAAGLRANTGTMTKPLHAGAAAMAGVQAARLAARGWDAHPEALEGPNGFCSAFMGPKVNEPVDFSADLGAWWSLLDPSGLAIKQYPSCGASHPAIQAALHVHEQLRGEPLRRIRVGVSALAPRLLVYSRPTTGNEGRFSAEYTVAASLVRGRISLDDFTDTAVTDPAVTALMDRIDVVVDDRHRDGTEFPATVAVETDSGRWVEHTVALARGKGGNPMSEAELQDKFTGCAGPDTGWLWRAVRHADEATPVARLVELTTSSSVPPTDPPTEPTVEAAMESTASSAGRGAQCLV